ncbi:HipA domain-containing protein [Cytobacillus firmus]|uniref:HipA domain-containing protein n=1 Tax=Cytobacillus firmus TaxID=1399 RepID=UPI00207A82E9|nr:HipA domain-containing protein [Cytobacillus firmus]USK40161.1 HipA domain-containing protein [Cytobacillus firmus]
MLKDISDWEHIGFGGKSTLEKEELRSPDKLKYFIKYPREFNEGVSWEDITELIAAEIGTILGLNMMKVEMVLRHGRRGCLLRNFVDEYDAMMAEEGGALLPSLLENYEEIQQSDLKNMELIEAGFNMIEEFDYWDFFKPEFINMQIFDILIGNQDRHPFNWQLLFFLREGVVFSPIYDNGASLGFRFDDNQLMSKTSNSQEMNKYTKKTRVKAGLFEKKSVKAKDLIEFLQNKYPDELESMRLRLDLFDTERYRLFIKSLSFLSDAQSAWLMNIIPFRREKILEWIGGSKNE